LKSPPLILSLPLSLSPVFPAREKRGRKLLPPFKILAWHHLLSSILIKEGATSLSETWSSFKSFGERAKISEREREREFSPLLRGALFFYHIEYA